jgi:hypothetical protein
MPSHDRSDPLFSASGLVRNYLAAMEDRDLGKASDFLADKFQMTFPGGVVLHTLEELVAWAEGRYRFVSKKYDRFDEAVTDSGIVVYCLGTLDGEWPDGSRFEGIRFIDRFTFCDDLLVDQQVWNDLAENARL